MRHTESPLYLLFIILSSILVLDGIFTFLIDDWAARALTLPPIASSAIHGLLLSISMFPILYGLMLRPLVQEVEQRRQVEAGLQQLSYAVEHSPVVVIITDLLGNIQYVNPKFMEVTGYSPSEVLGKSTRILKSGMHPPEFYKDLWDTLTTGKEWSGEFCNRKKNGELYWESAVISSIKESGRMTHFIAVKQDITEQKRLRQQMLEQERSYKDLFEGAPDPIVILNDLGRIQDLNPAALNAFNRGREELQGQPFPATGLLSSESISKVFQELVALLAGEHRKPFEVGLSTYAGERIFELNPRVIGTEQQRKVQVIFRDITDHVQTEQELKKAFRQLKEAQEQLVQAEKLASIGQFSSAIVHELKNPLAIIGQGIDYLERLGMHGSSVDSSEVFEMIHDAVRRQERIVHGLLDLSRPNKLKLEKHDITAVVQNALQATQPKHIGVKVVQAFNSVPPVMIDRDPMQQVFINLIENALDAMRGSGTLTLRIRTMEAQTGQERVGQRANDVFTPGQVLVCCEVSDTGDGIPEEILPKIFEPFFTTKSRGEGTGLGLAVVRGIVESHRGSIGVYSQRGQGTTFTVLLPRAVDTSLLA